MPSRCRTVLPPRRPPALPAVCHRVQGLSQPKTWWPAGDSRELPVDASRPSSALEPLALEEQAAANLQFDGSVVHTLMLPMWMEFSGGSDAVDMSALGSRSETQPGASRRAWIHPNSDADGVRFDSARTDAATEHSVSGGWSLPGCGAVRGGNCGWVRGGLRLSDGESRSVAEPGWSAGKAFRNFARHGL